MNRFLNPEPISCLIQGSNCCFLTQIQVSQETGKVVWYSDLFNSMNGCYLNLTDLDSILKSRDIALPTKVHLVKAMVLPVVMYGCESWTIKKAEC